MEAHLNACYLWEVVEGVYEAPWDIPAIAQIKIQKERKKKKGQKQEQPCLL